MPTHNVLKLAIGSDTNEFAKRLRLSSPLVHKWTEPSSDYTDSGTLNPLDRLLHIMEIALMLGRGEKDALAPLYYMAEHFNKIVISIPRKENCGALTQELLKTINEFSDMTKETSKALQDGEISGKEAERILKEGNEAIRCIASFMATVEESIS